MAVPLRPCPVCDTRMCTPGTPTCALCATTTAVPSADRTPLGPADCHNVRAVVLWERDADELRLCAHCSRHHGPTLRDHGWTIGATDLQAWQTQAPARA